LLRESIRDNRELDWTYQEQQEYLDFKRLATGFALFIASETLLNDETASQAFLDITDAQWETECWRH
jgi:hypothetical protein